MCPGVEDLVGVASPVGHESVLAVVVEGTGVVQGLVVAVGLSIARVMARSCQVTYSYGYGEYMIMIIII